MRGRLPPLEALRRVIDALEEARQPMRAEGAEGDGEEAVQSGE